MSAMAAETKRDPGLEWLDHVQPVGLVVASVVLNDLGLMPSRQTQADTAAVAEILIGPYAPSRRTLSQSPGVHDHELAQTRHSERG
jgi:hypothetical protein